MMMEVVLVLLQHIIVTVVQHFGCCQTTKGLSTTIPCTVLHTCITNLVGV